MKEHEHKTISLGDNNYILAFDIRCLICKNGFKHYAKELNSKQIPMITLSPTSIDSKGGKRGIIII